MTISLIGLGLLILFTDTVYLLVHLFCSQRTDITRAGRLKLDPSHDSYLKRKIQICVVQPYCV
jgi:hypothetical protein